MTCIVGLELGDGRVLFGADSMACGGGFYTTCTDAKIWRGPGYLLGGAGSSRLIDKLKFGTVLPRGPAAGSIVEAWLVNKFLPVAQPAARSVMRGGGDDDSDSDFVGLMVGVNGQVFLVDVLDGDIERSVHGFHALGSGSEVALGALFATARLEGFMPDPKDRLELALEASAARCIGVGAPFLFLEGKANSGRRKPDGNAAADSGGVRRGKGSAARKKPRVR